MVDIDDFAKSIQKEEYYTNCITQTIQNLSLTLKQLNHSVDFFKGKFVELVMFDGGDQIISATQARIVYVYLVQNTLLYINNPFIFSSEETLITLFDKSITQMRAFVDKNSWVDIEYEDTINPPAILSTKKQVRKVSKLEQAVELWKQNPQVSRKEFVKMLKTQLDMTPSGASTYYHNVKDIITREQSN